VATCLALGIGVNTAIFSVINSVVFRPLPYEDPAQLTMVWETYRTRNMVEGAVSYPNLAEWRSRNRVFEDIAAFHPTRHTLLDVDIPRRVQGVRVTAQYFPVLGVSAALGRTFVPEDDLEGADNVVVVSDGFWRRQFGADPSAIGQRINLDGTLHTVVGVVPPGFDFEIRVADPDVWTPTALDAFGFEQRAWPMLVAIGRLRRGFTLAQAQLEMDALGRELEQEFPATNTEHGFNIVPLHEQVVGGVRSLLVLLWGAVGVVLLIACVNVANMLLARVGARGTELAVRAAIGAGRSRLVRQLLTESVMLSLLGGVIGLLVATGGMRALISIIPPDTPRIGEIALALPAFGFALALSVVVGLVFGVVPAAIASRPTLVASLRQGARASAGVGYRRLRQGLLVTEIALALVLSVGAGLLIRSFQKMVTVDPGFEAAQVLTFQVAADWPDYPVDVRAAFYREVVQRMEALPGVTSAAAGTAMPLSRGFMATFRIEGQPEPERGTAPSTRYLSVTPEYFTTLEIPLLRGRLLAESDRRAGPGALVISRAAAEQFWPNEDPIGQRIIPDIDITSSDPVVYEVVGVVGDVKDVGLDSNAGPCMYVSHQQQTWPYMTVALRTVGDPLDLVTLVRTEVAEISQEPAIGFSLLEANLDGSVVRRRFPMAILTLFAALALTLAAVGIYGVLSYAVLQRRFEFGVRMVLGAQRRGVLGMVLKQTLAPVSLGAVAGMAIALATSRLLRGMLFEVSVVDPFTLVCVTAVLTCVALLACLGPTRRATSVDPVEALRSE